jgi:thioredoxin:protein disulfide reductase
MKKWFLFTIGCLLSFMSIASPPPADEVFQVSVNLVDPNTFTVNWLIKPGYFLYSDRIIVNIPKGSDISLGKIRLPEALKKTDSQGHVYTVYRKQLSIPISVLGEHPGETLIDLHYQGCADDGFCYPPETRQIKLGIDDKLALSTVEFYTSETPPQNEGVENSSNQVESVFFNQHWAMTLLIFYGFGLLLAFTPCILPMVPVLSGIIVGHGHAISTRKAFFLSLSYVVSMAITYAIVGAVVALLGSNLQIIMQSPWAISLFSILFIILALSMFGYFELKLPVSWQAKLALANRSQASGHYLSAAVMGCLSTLILSPCVTAPLIGVLSYIAHSGNIIMGGVSLFLLGLGMGTPLILIGTSAGRWLPKSGRWMNAVKYFFGVLLLAVAIYLLARILPTYLVMLLWATLFIFSGVYAGALIPAYSHHDKFKQASGIMLFVYGLLILIGASMGSTNPLQPLTSWGGGPAVSASWSTTTVSNLADVQKGIINAEGRPVILDFYADWCASCHEMEASTFKDPRVLAALKDFVVIKVDITANNSQAKALLQTYSVVAPPTFLFFNKQGMEIPKLTLVGEVNSEEFLKQLNLARISEA